MNHRLRIAACASAAVSAALGLTVTAAGASPHAAASKGSVNLALITDYTGSSSFEGPPDTAAVWSAVYDINHHGGVAGGYKLGVIEVDTRSDPADALPAVQRAYATSHNIVAAEGVPTDAAPTIIPFLNSQHTSMMSGAGQSQYNHTNLKYFWRTFAPDAATGLAYTLWAHEHGLNRIATVFGTDPGSQGDLPGVLEGIKDEHQTLTVELNLTPDQPNYQADVARLIASKPQVIVTEEDGPTAGTFFGELQQLGGMKPIYAFASATDPTWAGPVAGAIGTSTLDKNLTAFVDGAPAISPAQSVWQYDLNHAPNVATPHSKFYYSQRTAGIYDGVIVQALAMDAAHSTNPVIWNNAIKSVTEPGATKVKVYDYAEGVKALADHKAIQYIGIAGPIIFNQWHNSYAGLIPEALTPSGKPKILGDILPRQIQAMA